MLGDGMGFEQHFSNAIIWRISPAVRACARATATTGRLEAHDEHQRQTEHQHAQAFRINQHLAEHRHLGRADAIAQDLGQDAEQHRPENDAGNMPHAAEHDHRQNHDRLHQRKAFRRDETLHGGKDAAGDAAETGAHGEGQQLDVARIDADRLGGDFILANRLPGAANPRMLQAQVDDDDQDGQRDQQKVVLLRSTQE
jgi:hypothetical protein